MSTSNTCKNEAGNTEMTMNKIRYTETELKKQTKRDVVIQQENIQKGYLTSLETESTSRHAEHFSLRCDKQLNIEPERILEVSSPSTLNSFLNLIYKNSDRDEDNKLDYYGNRNFNMTVCLQ